MKPLGYGYIVNPVLRKREEERHLMIMERKIRAAKSTLPSGARGIPVSARAKQKSGARDPAGAYEGTHQRDIDDLIQARLEDILGMDMIKNIQSLVRRGPVPGIDKQKSGIERSPSLGRPPKQTARRPQWKDDWASSPPVAKPSDAMASGRVLGLTRASSVPRDSGLEKSTSPLQRLSDKGQRATKEQPSRAAKPASGRPLPAAPPSARVQLLSQNLSSPFGSPGRPNSSSSRYAVGQASPVAPGEAPSRGGGRPPDTLSLSDACAIAVLNPAAQLGAAGQAAGARRAAATSRQEAMAPAVAAFPPPLLLVPQGSRTSGPDDGSCLMSLSRLSLGCSPAPDRGQGSCASRAGVQRQSSLDTGLAEDDEYEDDFEPLECDEPQPDGSSYKGRHQSSAPSAEVDVLHRSVAVLNELVQMKIRTMASHDQGVEADEGAAQTAREAERSMGLVGGDAETGLGPFEARVAGDPLLNLSDLEYIGYLGQGAGAEGEGEQDLDMQIEAAGPVGSTNVWGTRATLPNAAASGQQQQQQLALDPKPDSIPSEHRDVSHSDESARQSLAIEAKALFSSLRQLHELMTGPRGSKLSPRGGGELSKAPSGFSMPGGGWVVSPPEVAGEPSGLSETPRSIATGTAFQPPAPCGEPDEADEGLAVATFGPSVDADLPLAAAGTTLTPKNQLCAADVRWMASLMRTLSASMQGLENGIDDWQNGVDWDELLP